MNKQGKVRLGRKTKDLVKELEQKEIAVIDHEDLDAMGAMGLLQAKVICVINASQSISGRYPNLGPKILLEKDVPIIDNVGKNIFELLTSGDNISIQDGKIFCGENEIAVGSELTLEIVLEKMEDAKTNINIEIDKFVDNTIEYVKKEKETILAGINFPDISVPIKERHMVVVIRGVGYRDDLKAISSYIEEVQPVLVGVDGGADALLEFGHIPDIIIGDMDSVSDKALLGGTQILVHAYQDGSCPGEDRLQELQVPYKILPAPGTSEDIALLLGYQNGASLIVAVGTHSNLIDFLEKGRPGMSSTFLVRMKIGSILVDAKGVSKLSMGNSGYFSFPVLVAATVPILLFIALASPWRHLVRLLWLQLRLFLGGM